MLRKLALEDREKTAVNLKDVDASLRNRVPKTPPQQHRVARTGRALRALPDYRVVGGQAPQHPPGNILSPTYSRQERGT